MKRIDYIFKRLIIFLDNNKSVKICDAIDIVSPKETLDGRRLLLEMLIQKMEGRI